jgi:hypothetical protein
VIFYQENSFSFSVNGELDEDELKAIGQLVADANELTEEFFNGDIETAFNQALELVRSMTMRLSLHTPRFSHIESSLKPGLQIILNNGMKIAVYSS